MRSGTKWRAASCAAPCLGLTNVIFQLPLLLLHFRVQGGVDRISVEKQYEVLCLQRGVAEMKLYLSDGHKQWPQRQRLPYVL